MSKYVKSYLISRDFIPEIYEVKFLSTLQRICIRKTRAISELGLLLDSK